MKVEEITIKEWKIWLYTSLIIGLLFSILIALGEYYLWKDYLDIRVGLTLGIIFSFLNLSLAYLKGC